MTAEEKQELEKMLEDEDKEIFDLSKYTKDEQKRIKQSIKKAQKAAQEYVTKNFTLPDTEPWQKVIQNILSEYTHKINPDKIPAELMEDDEVKTLADQIRNGDIRKAKETVLRMPIVTLLKLRQAFESGTEPEITQLERLKRIKYYSVMNDKLVHELIRTEPVRNEIIENQNGKDTKKEVLNWGANMLQDDKPMKAPVYVTLYAENNQPVEKEKVFDYAIQSAIVALAQPTEKDPSGHYPVNVTPDQIFRVINGMRDVKRTARPKQAEEIEKRLDKMRTNIISIDHTEELKLNYSFSDSKIKQGVFEDNEIHARSITIKTENNRRVKGYQILCEPILHQYNREKNHLLLVPYELLNISETDIVKYITEFKYYLLRRIENQYYYYDPKDKPTFSVKFDTLYTETGILPPEQRLNADNYKDDETYKSNIRKQRAKDRKKIEKILSDWQSKGYISGFEFIEKKNLINITLSGKLLKLRERNKALDPEMLNL